MVSMAQQYESYLRTIDSICVGILLILLITVRLLLL